MRAAVPHVPGTPALIRPDIFSISGFSSSRWRLPRYIRRRMSAVRSAQRSLLRPVGTLQTRKRTADRDGHLQPRAVFVDPNTTVLQARGYQNAITYTEIDG